MKTPEQRNIATGAPDSVASGIAAARAARGWTERAEILESLAAKFANRWTARELRDLARLGRDLAASNELCDRLIGSEPLTRWLSAAIFEARGLHQAAADALSPVPDTGWNEARAIWLMALARNLAGAGRWSEVWNPLRDAVRLSEDWQVLTQADQLLSRARKGGVTIAARARKRVALIGTGSLSFWGPILRPAGFAAGVDIDLHVGEFNQYRQEILDSQSPLHEFRPEVVILATDWRTPGLPVEVGDPQGVIAGQIAELCALWRKCAEQWGAAVIQHNFEVPEFDPLGRLSAELPGGRARVLKQLNLALSEAAAAENAAILDVDQVAGVFGKRQWSDPTAWTTAKQYPAMAALPLLARYQAALIRALAGLTSKCLVLDLDGTLWGGVIGEDGTAGIRLGGSPEGEARVSFQHYVRTLRDRGILLAVCSKNNPEDALEPFRNHPEMILKPDDFAAFVANWQPKPENLRQIAETINIGLDSLVFVDDNPVERAQVRAALAEVEVPEMPDDPALWEAVLSRSLLFEAVSLTADDRGRAATYRENAVRAELLSASGNVEDFLRDLQMHVELRPFDPSNLPRIVQLINKTNQFNLTTRRVTTAGVEQMMGDPLWYTQFVRVRDRFGDNGITGILIARREGNTWRIDNWLLSCRVLGRKIEDTMLTGLLRFATADGAEQIIGEYLPTAKNRQVASLYERLGFRRTRQSEDGAAVFVRELDGESLEFPEWVKVSVGEDQAVRA